MLSTLIFDEYSVQTMLQMKQFANQRFTPNGLLILARDFLSFFRMCEVETKLFHTWWDLDLDLGKVPLVARRGHCQDLIFNLI